MWLISTSCRSCFWLLLMLLFSLVGVGVVLSDMYCYHCRNDDKECPDASRPFNTIPCTDPAAVCLMIIGYYAVGVPDRRKVFYRGCAHPDWITEFGGEPNTCKEQKDGGQMWNTAFNWVKDNPTKYTGGTQTFRLKTPLEYEICSCNAANKCNDLMGTVGEPYPPPPKTPPNNQCVCDDNENKCVGRRGKSGSEVARHHFPSTVALGSVIILSGRWRSVHNHNHIGGF